MIGILLALATASPPSCQPLVGANAFAQQTKARWIVLGESEHGTVEQPQAATDLICALIKTHRPITVAIEHSEIEQPLIDAFLASDGGYVAVLTLFQGTNWDTKRQDGKGSEAMLHLLDWLRVNVKAGRIRRVSAFDAASASDNADRNRRMARNLENLRPGNAEIVVILAGAAHAQGEAYGQGKNAFQPAAALLPPQETVRILIEGEGGAAFGCRNQGCRIYPVPPRMHFARGLRMAPSERGFDGILELGTPETASRPANPN